jgi:hypothetical protein
MSANGRLSRPELSRIHHPKLTLFLSLEAAASWNTMRLYALQRDALDLYPEGALGAYRNYAGQVQMRRYWCSLGRCGNAASPGTSNHGWGRAVDSLSAAMWTWIDEHGAYFGWHHWDARWESWHREYDGGFHRPNPGISPAYPVLAMGSGGLGQASYVQELQRRLTRHGRKLAVDGEFFWATKRALQAFQAACHLRPTGITDPATWRLLRR